MVLAVFATGLFAATAVAQTYDVLHSFVYSDGASPSGPIQGTDGKLYGTTAGGGANGRGTIFRIDTDGTPPETLHSFAGGDGSQPYAGLVQGTDGNLYGTTYGGGADGAGTVFKINTTGTTFATLHSFSFGVGAGAVPQEAGLIQGTDGNLYGTTSEGGAGDWGTIFKIDTDGTTLTTLHSFAASDGADPGHAGLIQGTDGNLYGTTYSGGASGRGTIFKIDTNGTMFATLHDFVGYPTDGAYPFGGLVQGTDGNLYGTTFDGGENGLGTTFKIDINGITYTTLRNFAGGNGAGPSAGLIQATDGNLYGTTYQGGASGDGTIFKMDVSGNVTTLHSFAGSNGSNPFTALIQATDGNFYGATALSGGEGADVLFRLSMCDSPTAAVSGTTSICNGSSTTIQATLTGTAPWNLVWSDGVTQTGVASSPATRTVGPSAATTYSVASVSDAFCAGTSSGDATITVNPQPPPSAVITAPVSVCANSAGNDASVPNAGSAATYSWAITNGTITQGAGTRKIEFTAGPGGPVGLTVVVTTASCSSAGSANLAVNPRPSAAIAAPAFVCRNSTGYVASVPDAGPGATYAWTVMRGTLTSGAGTNAITFSTGNRAVTIRVTVTNADGCSSSSETVVPLSPGC